MWVPGGVWRMAFSTGQVYFNAKNLLNTPLRYFEGSSNRPIRREFYDATFGVASGRTFRTMAASARPPADLQPATVASGSIPD